MFIAIVGTRHSGRKSVAEYLLSQGFKLLTLSNGATSSPGLEFDSPQEMLAFVTKHWQDDFVTIDLINVHAIETFAKRPFFMLVSVDAPLLTRFRRSVLYKLSSLSDLSRFVKVHIVNYFETLPLLYQHLDSLCLLDQDRLRPCWDTYFMMLASLASMRSNCMKRRVGAILVREKRIVATGYNGTPRGLINCNEGGCTKCNGTGTNNEACLCLHAEENALLEAGRERMAGATLYCNTCPCLTCTIKIVQVGVREVVYNLSYKVDDASAKLFQDAGVTLRRHAPPP
ncbi:cytidine deaminase-like protein [Vararia minispora EC-137]|uniref:Cytidine deaminase-like protein n=1 Tax=Vararia minispora EC-137 TaxID=1314806 RepID=A0ACB8QI60_9AGAM|nr:cytidine deaminase-like protein [Vararia minispora EC-137]